MAKTMGQKRQATQVDMESEEGPRRTRGKVSEEANHYRRSTRSSDQSSSSVPAKKTPSPKIPTSAKKKIVKKGIARPVTKNAKSNISWKPKPKAKPVSRRGSFSKVVIANGDTLDDAEAEASSEDNEEDGPDGPAYWLMKAEPNSRIEKGKDVKFSIDDLRQASEPEAWDGIVGTMEVVREHSVDGKHPTYHADKLVNSHFRTESAFDKEHPYYDEKSTRDKPKWCVVHVEFRTKFHEPVALKELQKFAKPGGILEKMQTLKMSRLSVSKVSKKEWDFIHTLIDSDANGATTPNGAES
ncbi:MAG: hypothetical protein Q9169_005040 [Polycauliona sp. 2 TL-2023]